MTDGADTEFSTLFKKAAELAEHMDVQISIQTLVILATLPVTTAEAERVFSKVERTATAARVHND